MADNDMMIVPGFGQMTRKQVEREKLAINKDYRELDSDASDYAYKRKIIKDKMDALIKAHPVGAKKSVRLI